MLPQNRSLRDLRLLWALMENGRLVFETVAPILFSFPTSYLPWR